ncbi:MAG: DUF2163 domain-containing protein [Paracoccus sp. (in: a-proteobacteria)]|uniref:DUF2163 domain-containing protein n=1 Tax=Paracoccus sp. TaxID=267 RepID=UPI0026DF3F12|nr:DUF2163 domain-containing protein [Paracoccus sp. (in: a-proteobacteria)]MDO5630438.1 DUF2163 domain-containing protein [Paracoccus sp. (in: a-proteobacteria)]
MSATCFARAWAITRRDGVVLGFTDHDSVLEFEGISFRPEHGMSAMALVQAAGLSVDNTEAEGALTDDAITEIDLMAGRWDGAELLMWEVDWTALDMRRLVFRGSLGEIVRSRGAFRAELRGLSEPLNHSRGRVYHPRCSAGLGDSKCGVDLVRDGLFARWPLASCVEGRLFRFAESGFEARWFERGVLHVETGAAAGLRARIKNDRARAGGGREIELWSALAIVPAPGDVIRLVAGCDKSPRACRFKFDNYLNFRGFPHLPGEDWLAAPQSGSRRVDNSGYERANIWAPAPEDTYGA